MKKSKLKKMSKFSNAVQIAATTIINDPELKKTYKDNISILFQDAYLKARKKKGYVNNSEIKKIADSAALKFEYAVVDVENDPNELAKANQVFNYGLFNTDFTLAPPSDKVGIASIALDVIF